MVRVRWKGVEERYWPDTEKPWRVAIGMYEFKDFATQAEAQDFYEEELMKKPPGPTRLRPPVNVVELRP